MGKPASVGRRRIRRGLRSERARRGTSGATLRPESGSQGHSGLNETAGDGTRRAAVPARHQRQALLQVHHGGPDGSLPIPDHVADRQIVGGPEEGERARRRTIQTVQPVHVALRGNRNAGIHSGTAQNRIRYLHRDLKPANFAVGREPDLRRVYMLDFGMCRKYRKDDGTHRRPHDRLGFRGTVRFASPACHKEEELSRRDCLWSWLFMIVDLTRGTSHADMMNKIGESKDASLLGNGKILLEGCPREFQEAYDHTVKLQYADEPNYDLIKSSWQLCMQRKGYATEQPLDWEPKGEHFKEMQAVPHATMLVEDKVREEMLKKSFEDKKKK